MLMRMRMDTGGCAHVNAHSYTIRTRVPCARKDTRKGACAYTCAGIRVRLRVPLHQPHCTTAFIHASKLRVNSSDETTSIEASLRIFGDEMLIVTSVSAPL
jgi:hypothetical protein